jgi:hypothetical protein
MSLLSQQQDKVHRRRTDLENRLQTMLQAQTSMYLGSRSFKVNTLMIVEDVRKAEDDSELPPLDDRLVASAAARLDAAEIPHVLWGNYMLTIFGIPTVVNVGTSH